MGQTRVLITVTAYPLPSRSHDELVCTAGLLENGNWIRIYPVPFKFLEFGKYQWVELDLVRQDSKRDFRPESHRPKYYDLSDLQIGEKIDTQQGWYERKQLCLRGAYSNMTELIEASKAPSNKSLAVFTPTRIKNLLIEPDEREWKEDWREQLKQVDLFTGGSGRQSQILIDKIPYKFKYRFEDDDGRESTMSIEDWEIGALYRNCLAMAEGDETVAVEKVREKYEYDFLRNKEVSLFLGTTLEHHRARHSNPFTIIGVFYPPADRQEALF
jgi:hypothetical protein